MAPLIDEIKEYQRERKLCLEKGRELDTKIIQEISPLIQLECQKHCLDVYLGDYMAQPNITPLGGVTLSFIVEGGDQRSYDHINQKLRPLYGQIRSQYGVTVIGFIRER